MSASPRILLFELYHQGHHSSYVRAVLAHWLHLNPQGSLDVAVSHELAERVPEIAEAARTHPHVTFHPITIPGGLLAKTGSRAVLRNDLRMGPLLKRAIEQSQPDHVLAMYLDHLQASLATALRFRFPVHVSGIYFRPALHYAAMGRGADTQRARLDRKIKRVLLRRALANPHVDTVLTLDPYAVEPVQALAPPHVRVGHIPEPFDAGTRSSETRDATRRRLGVEDNRKLLLLYGSMDPRKGVTELLAALAALPPVLARNACLVMAGETTGGAEAINSGIETLRAENDVQVIRIDRFVTDDEMQPVFTAADLVLLPYQWHVGSSNVLVRAASAGVPVLGPQYGMLGARIDEHRLGLSVNTANPQAIMQGLVKALDPALEFPFSAAAASALARDNSDEAMAGALLAPALATVTR